MKKIAFMLVYLFTAQAVIAQEFEWVRHAQVNYSFNPSYTEYPVDYDKVNDHILHARLDSFSSIYGSVVLGKVMVESRDTNGSVIWSVPFGNDAFIKKIVVNPSGEVIAGGQFRETMHIGATDSIEFINVGFNGWNFFLVKFDIQGNLVWKRNMSATWPLYDGIEAMTIDHNGNCWYAITDFFTAKLVRTDAGGNDNLVRSIENGKTIGHFVFDNSGGMYVSGGAQNGNFIMDTDTFNAPFSYNMFIARYNAQGFPAWAYFGNDITFQRPMITTDPDGNVFFAGLRFDSTSFNGTFIPPPYPAGDFFAFKADTSCNVQWVVRQPQLLIGPFGSFDPGSALNVDADAAGNFYMGGIQQGTVDWSNGYISSTTGFADRRTAIARISPAGSTEWVKIGGSSGSNYMHALTVSDGGSCYFTGSFSDTAVFDNVIIPTNAFYNFMLGKIRTIPTAIPDITQHNLSVFPNPSCGIITIPSLKKGSLVFVHDIAGKIVRTEIISQLNTIDISTLAPGCYVITTGEKNTGAARFTRMKE